MKAVRFRSRPPPSSPTSLAASHICIYDCVTSATAREASVKFVTVRDLRGRSAEVWRELAVEHEMVVTSNGKPIAILTSTSEETFEKSIREVRRARAMQAVSALQQRSVAVERDGITDKEVDAEIAAVRAARRR